MRIMDIGKQDKEKKYIEPVRPPVPVPVPVPKKEPVKA